MAARCCYPCIACCDATGDFVFPEDRPSPIFSTFAVIVNAVFVVMAIVFIAQGPCDGDPLLWTILGLCSAVVNIGFAIYLYARFTYKARHEGASAGSAACSILLYDWGVCLYMLFTCWLIAWMVLAGRSWRNAADDDKCGQMCRNGIIIFIIYFVAGFFLILLSLVTECCRTPHWRRDAAGHGAASSPPYHADQRSPTLRERVFGRRHDTAAPQQHQQQQFATQERRPNVVERTIDRVDRALGGGHHHQTPTQPQPYQASPAANFNAAPAHGAYYGTSHAPPARNPGYVA